MPSRNIMTSRAIGHLLLVALATMSAEAFAPSPESSQTATSLKDTPTQQWDVDLYRDKHNFVWEYGADLMELTQLQPGERVLDLGCGSGELTHQLSQLQPNIHSMGMDADASMVIQAQSQFPHLNFFQGDMRSFAVDEPVDVIFSNAALHWVPPKDIERAVQSMARALKPGGRFVVEFGGRGNVDKIVQATCRELNKPLEDSPWYFPSIPHFCSLLEQHGIEVTSAHLFDRPTVLDGEKGLRNWLTMFGSAFFQGMEDREIEQALDRIDEALVDDLFDGTSWTADYRRIRIVGQKIID